MRASGLASPFANSVNDSVSRGAQRVYERSHRAQAGQRRFRPAVEQSKIAGVPGRCASRYALLLRVTAHKPENSGAKLLNVVSAKPDALEYLISAETLHKFRDE